MRSISINILFFLLLCTSLRAQTVAEPPRGGTGLSLGVADTNQILITQGRNPMRKLAWLNDSTFFLGSDLSWHHVSGGSGGGLINWIDSTSTVAPNAITNTSIFLAKDTSANADAVIMPKGNGALLAQNPDGTSVGGNKRGQYAIDFQRIHGSSSQVASGDRTFIGNGNANTVSAQYSSIINGAQNTISDQYGFIGGGQQNAINNGNFAFESCIGAGDHNVINGQHSFIGAGNNNTINAGQFNSSASFIGSGQNNSIQGTECVIAGGDANTMNTFNSVQSSILGGANNNIQGFNLSAIVGGTNNSMINGGAYNTIAGGEFLRFNGTSGNFGFKNGGSLMTVSTSGLSVFGNTDLWLANNDNKARAVIFFAPYNSAGNFDSSTVHYVGFRAGAISTSVIWKLPLADATISGQVLSSDAAGNLSWITAGGGGAGLVNWIDSINTSAPNATVPAVALVALNAATNVDAVIQPKGTGAFLAQIPNNATSGGNKRGVHATDLQTKRLAAADVANADYSTISGGQSNFIDPAGTNTAIGGGSFNFAYGLNNTIAGGRSNTASGFYATVGGGQSNGAVDSSVVSGGANNNINAGASGSAIFGGVNFVLGSTALGSFGFNGENPGLGNPSFENDTAQVGTLNDVSLWLTNGDSLARSLRFYAPWNINTTGGDFNGVKYVGFQAGVVTTSTVWTLPLADGSAGQLLKTDGAGNLSWIAAGGTGSVTSVALSLPAFITVSGSPVTTSGTLTGTLASQAQNLFFASPNGSSGAPTFRAIVLADLPATYQYYAWSTNATTSFTATVANAYNTTAGSQATVTLPSATDNQRVLVKGNNTGGWIITLSGQTIHFPGQDYSTSIASTDGSVELIYNAATSKWDVLSMTGTITPL